MKELTVDATIDNMDSVIAFVDELLEENDCSMKAQMQIDVAIDEMMSNIAYYAYESGTGKVTIQVSFVDEPNRALISFLDSGVPYNPLEKEDPDVTLSAEERNIGGLGIFMVKKTMDEVAYAYRDGQNVFTMTKVIE